jgi:PERQ amino acid-rich with GYF domain-containing protein
MFAGGSTGQPKKRTEEIAPSNPQRLSGIREDTKFDEANSSADIDLSTKLSDDSNTQFNVNVDYPTGQASYTDTKSSGQDSYPEELTLYYLDPQGGVQGPFMGTDIVSWYEDGYFGLELPVRLSQAPEEAPFRPLSELMPYLGHKPQSVPPVTSVGSAESSDSVHNNFEDAQPTSGPFGKSDQTSKGDSENYGVNPKKGDQEAPVQSHASWFPSSEAEKAEANLDIRQQHIPETVIQDAEG